MFLKNQSVFKSPLTTGSLFSKEKKTQQKKAVATLMLTPLIDAFSILVVYLLMFFSNAGEMTYVSAGIDLPSASSIERLDRHSIISIKEEGYFVEQKKISAERLSDYLINLKKQIDQSSFPGSLENPRDVITIQADKKIKYNRMSAVIQACSHAGFSRIKFAALGE